MSNTKNKMTDLRNHLFTALERLNEENTNELKLGMEIERAKAISEVAQTIINSAKVEVDYLEVTGASAQSEFLEVSNGHALPEKTAPRKGLSTGKSLGNEPV